MSLSSPLTICALVTSGDTTLVKGGRGEGGRGEGGRGEGGREEGGEKREGDISRN